MAEGGPSNPNRRASWEGAIPSAVDSITTGSYQTVNSSRGSVGAFGWFHFQDTCSVELSYSV